MSPASWLRRSRLVAAAVSLWAITACGPYLAPTVVPQPAAELEPLRAALLVYLEQTQAYRKNAAEQAESVPNQVSSPARAEDAVRVRERAMADAIRTNVRPNARVGDLLTPPIATLLREQLRVAFESPRLELIRDELREQNEGGDADAPLPGINETATVPRVPPVLLEVLPVLPAQLEFAFQHRTLILRDVDANIVIDMVPDAFPETAEAGISPLEPAVPQSRARAPVLPMPDVRGVTVFAAIGDSGTGDTAQHQVAEAMLRYFSYSRRFAFVLMLGDNLYGDDYVGEFSLPYKGLLERGVTFYAALGNHDRESQIHYKPFHMDDRPFYAFTRGNARFVALNSNTPSDAAQAKWLETAYGDDDTKWRIAFFHHPLYSSGNHARQSRDAIRPSLEPLLIRNKVNVAFSGHEHLYERIAPQKAVRYFVSGGGGRQLYRVDMSPFDEVAVSAFHFMVLAVVDDRLFFQAITPEDRMIDCGMLWRTPEAERKGPDAATVRWLDACRAATQQVSRTSQR